MRGGEALHRRVLLRRRRGGCGVHNVPEKVLTLSEVCSFPSNSCQIEGYWKITILGRVHVGRGQTYWCTIVQCVPPEI